MPIPKLVIKKRVDDFDKAINVRLDEANFVNNADNVYYLDDDLDSVMKYSGRNEDT